MLPCPAGQLACGSQISSSSLARTQTSTYVAKVKSFTIVRNVQTSKILYVQLNTLYVPLVQLQIFNILSAAIKLLHVIMVFGIATPYVYRSVYCCQQLKQVQSIIFELYNQLLVAASTCVSVQTCYIQASLSLDCLNKINIHYEHPQFSGLLC